MVTKNAGVKLTLMQYQNLVRAAAVLSEVMLHTVLKAEGVDQEILMDTLRETGRRGENGVRLDGSVDITVKRRLGFVVSWDISFRDGPMFKAITKGLDESGIAYEWVPEPSEGSLVDGRPADTKGRILDNIALYADEDQRTVALDITHSTRLPMPVYKPRIKKKQPKE